MNTFLLHLSLCLGVFSGPSVAGQNPERAATDRPNVILFMADDLGWGEVGYQGQTRIRTPHIDRLAAAGMRFSQAYSGHTVCAPSRCVLLTGLHTGHAQVRGNSPWSSPLHVLAEGQEPLRYDTLTFGRVLQSAGYATGAFGKWGVGAPGDEGRPLAQGFDTFVGFMCQKRAHDHYPPALWKDGEPLVLNNPGYTPSKRWSQVPQGEDPWAAFSGEDYAADVMLDEALAFLDRNQAAPFLLYFPTPVPHASLQVPEESLEEYLESGWDDGPYLGDKGYLPHRSPRAAYAAMVTRMDAGLGRLLAKVDELGLAKNTLVIFTSDNGATFNGGTDSAFFESNGNLRGFKTSLWEGGIRVPFVARWEGQIPAASVNSTPIGFQDVLPTLAELVGQPNPTGLDGVSLVEILRDPKADLPERDLYFETGQRQALRSGDLKVMTHVKKDGSRSFSLYDLAKDPEESNDISKKVDGKILEGMLGRLAAQHTPSPRFPIAGDPPLWDASKRGSQEVRTLELTSGARASVPSTTTDSPLVILIPDAKRKPQDYESLAQHLASHGLSVLTVLAGEGFSPTDPSPMEQAWALDVEDLRARVGGVSSGPWGVLAHGTGARIAVALGATSERVGALCLLQPAGVNEQTHEQMKGCAAATLVLVGGADDSCDFVAINRFAQMGPASARRLYCNIPDLAQGALWDQVNSDREQAPRAAQRSIVLEFLLTELTGDTRAGEYLITRRGKWKVGHPFALQP